MTERVTVRAGVGYQLSPIDDNVRNYRLPYNDALLPSVGASYSARRALLVSISATAYSIVEDMDIRAADAGGPDANGPFSGHADVHAHYISAAIKVKL